MALLGVGASSLQDRHGEQPDSLEALNAKCMTAIVQAAYRSYYAFPDTHFVHDAHLHDCNNLRDGGKRILARDQR